MNSLKKLTALADKIEAKLAKYGQQQSAQPGDIETALKGANAWPAPNDMAPLLNAAKVPDDASVDVKFVVDSHLNINFKVTSNKQGGFTIALERLLHQKYGGVMSNALKQAKLAVAGTMMVNLATFA